MAFVLAAMPTVTAAFGPKKAAPAPAKTVKKPAFGAKKPVVKKSAVKAAPVRKGGKGQRSGNQGPNRTLWYPSGEAGRCPPPSLHTRAPGTNCVFIE